MTTEREDEVVERLQFLIAEFGDDGWMQEAIDTIAALKAKCEKAENLNLNYVGICNAWSRDYKGEKERGDLWMADCKAAEAKCVELEKMLFLGDQLADWINTVAPVLQGMMDAYERRIRSLCSPAELENRPWECAEWIVARDMLNKKPIAIVEISALPQPSDTQRDG